jgi:surface polysaccharide O-acyltransferase-like enzyme
MLLYGTAIHLWFLPMILPANLSAVWLARKWAMIPARRVSLAATWIGAAVLLLSAYLRLHVAIGPPFGQWLFSLGCIPLGLAVGRAISLGIDRRRPLAEIAIVAVALFAASQFGPRSAPIEWSLIARFAAALCLVSVAAMWSGQTHPILQTLVRSTLGIYLIHPMLTTITSEYCLRVESRVGETLLIYLGSLVLVLLLRRTALSRFV